MPESAERQRKMDAALKDIITLTDEKVRLAEMISAMSAPAASTLGLGYNVPMVDLGQLQQLLTQAYPQQGQSPPPKDDGTLGAPTEHVDHSQALGMMDHSHHLLNKGSDSLADYVHDHAQGEQFAQFPMMHEDSANDSDAV
jgi:hypothetical protein